MKSLAFAHIMASLSTDCHTNHHVPPFRQRNVVRLTFLINEALPDDKPILLPQAFANADLDGDVDVDQDDFEALVAVLLGE